MSEHRILGVDPGLRTTGYGVIEADGRGLRLIEAGILRPAPALALEQRLVQLHDAMVDVVRTTHPSCMVIEELWSAYEHPQTAVLMGHARGVLALAAGANGIVVHHLAHTVVNSPSPAAGRRAKRRSKGWSCGCSDYVSRRSPTTSPTPSRWRSPSPFARRPACRRRSALRVRDAGAALPGGI